MMPVLFNSNLCISQVTYVQGVMQWYARIDSPLVEVSRSNLAPAGFFTPDSI